MVFRPVSLKAAAAKSPHKLTVGKCHGVSKTLVEAEVQTYCKSLRDEDIAVGTKVLIVKALSIHPSFHGGRAKALSNWVYEFLNRNHLCLRRPTRQGQKRSNHLQATMDDFVGNVNDRFLSFEAWRKSVWVPFIGDESPSVLLLDDYKCHKQPSFTRKVAKVVHKDGLNNTSVSFGALTLVFAQGGAVVLYNDGNIVRKVLFLLQQAQREEAGVACLLAGNKAEHLENLFEVPIFAFNLKAANNQVVDSPVKSPQVCLCARRLMELKAVDIVGVSSGEGTRSCTCHDMCGDSLTVDDLVVCRLEVQGESVNLKEVLKVFLLVASE
ncbi:hypothetical protein H257_16888 [Aphanomyces astaci]|uniref:HTH CENPB-type domain-containing protein n=1 Tax=Aphanomyces astaci TaxID=112090 RepID=W4FIW9_APHAT|nr:hypothetical protein H257_16888 [Aphanomyces astaci]ETV66673.1 hypothetical protein H257_16888 [Aphanomyces astaci]|eukprot:XP_009843798.1 hypothetical protein H257_16888 [Aphanomyces astaci]